MKKLRERDGTARHIRHASYHISFCRHRQNDSFFLQLAQQMEEKRKNLIIASRAAEDEEDKVTALFADTNFAELALEDMVRDLEADLGKIDRQDPTLNVHEQVFPNGIGAIITPEGESQLPVINEFRQRLAAFDKHSWMSPLISRADKAISDFKIALDGKKKGETSLEEVRAKEQQAKTEVREQLVSAYGQLVARFKSRPKFAERYFYQERGADKPDEPATNTDRARAQGKAEALLRILSVRKIEVDGADVVRLSAAVESAQLDLWIERALTATKISDVLI